MRLEDSAYVSVQSPGGLGESTTALDLRKPGDVNLVYRAVVNGWDVPQHIRDQICHQLDGALVAIPFGHSRGARRVIKLCKLAVMMEARNMIGEGHPRSDFLYLRRRGPEKRRPRCR